MTTPGLYPKITRKDYDAIEAFNYSLIKHGRKTMRHIKAHMCLKKEADKTCWKVGRAFETLLYNGHPAFEAQFIKAPEGFRSNATKKWASFIEEAGEREILAHGDYNKILNMHQSCVWEDEFMEFVRRPGERGLGVVWVDDDSGLLLKGLIDEVSITERSITDLKTSKSESDRGFFYAIKDYDYDIQAAMYIDGCAALDIEIDTWTWLVQGKTWPYMTNIIDAPPELIERGRNGDEWTRGYKPILRDLAQCIRTDKWPGHGGRHVLNSNVPVKGVEVDEEVFG